MAEDPNHRTMNIDPGGDISHDILLKGNQILLRSYGYIYLFNIHKTFTVALNKTYRQPPDP